jgi:Lipase (class 3)
MIAQLKHRHLLFALVFSAAGCLDSPNEPGSALVVDEISRESPFTPTRAVFHALSVGMGDLGREISHMQFDDSAGGLESQVFYANVDEIDEIDENDENDPLLSALRAAAEQRKTIFLDSQSEDRDLVSTVGQLLFGDQSGPHSYLLLAQWNGHEWETLRTFDAIIPSLGRSIVPPDSQTPSETRFAVGAIGGTVAMPLIEFAGAAYTGAEVKSGSRTYRSAYRSAEGNVTLYRERGSVWGWGSRCVVAWRGASESFDWKTTNWENALSAVKIALATWIAGANPTYEHPVITNLLVGEGYERRYNKNLRTDDKIRALLDNDCKHVRIAGHSLGGAMALYTAFVWSYENPNKWYKNLHEIEAFNAPAVGNARYLKDFQSRVVNQKVTHNYCRSYDPVSVGIDNFPSFCTLTGAAVVEPSWWNPKTSMKAFGENHKWQYWQQCTSVSDC